MITCPACAVRARGAFFVCLGGETMGRLKMLWRTTARYELVEALAFYATFPLLALALYAATMGVLAWVP